MFWRTVLSLAGVVVIVASAFANEESESDGKDKGLSKHVWMEQKVDLSKKTLEALSLGDLEEVAKNARTMGLLSKVEGWARRSEKKEYLRQLRYFEAANSQMLNAASAENMEGATLAFNQMVISCVACHQHLRDGKPQSNAASDK